MPPLRILKNDENWAYSLLWIVVGAIWSLLVRWRVRGMDRTPGRGSLLVIANHTSNLDPLLVGLAVPRWVRFLSKDDIFRWPVVGTLARVFRVIPMNRRKTDHRALRASVEVLRRGGVLCLFPEGTRGKLGCLQRGQPGAALIASRTGAPILPLGITGGRESLHGWGIPLLRRTITVQVGQPFTLPQQDGKMDRHTAQAMADIMMMRIAELLPPERRGPYAQPPVSPDEVSIMAMTRENGDDKLVMRSKDD